MMSGQLRAVAVVVAVAAIVFVVYRHQHHNYRSSGPAVPINVLVSSKEIQKGTSGDIIRKTASYYKLTPYPQNQVENGAIVDPSVLAGEWAVKDIPTGQQLTTADFARPDNPIPVVPGARRALVISAKGIGSQITAGSHVDVWIATKEHGSTARRELDRNMQVLSVSSSDGTLALVATTRQAGKLIYASAHGQLVVRLHR